LALSFTSGFTSAPQILACYPQFSVRKIVTVNRIILLLISSSIDRKAFNVHTAECKQSNEDCVE